MGFALQFSGSLDPIGITVNKQLQHCLGIVFGIAYLIGIDLDPLGVKVQGFHKGIVGSDRVVCGHIVFDAAGE
jgi:hypothetical protein